MYFAGKLVYLIVRASNKLAVKVNVFYLCYLYIYNYNTESLVVYYILLTLHSRQTKSKLIRILYDYNRLFIKATVTLMGG